MIDSRKARRTHRSPASGFSGEPRDEALAERLRRIAEEQSKKAIEELERREKERSVSAKTGRKK
jgi:methylase of polypeptide subunit release factors